MPVPLTLFVSHSAIDPLFTSHGDLYPPPTHFPCGHYASRCCMSRDNTVTTAHCHKGILPSNPGKTHLGQGHMRGLEPATLQEVEEGDGCLKVPQSCPPLRRKKQGTLYLLQEDDMVT